MKCLGPIKGLKKSKVSMSHIPDYYFIIHPLLSKILEKTQSIRAGILNLHDVIRMNKQVEVGELNNFFMVMEVYGSGSNFFSAEFFQDGYYKLSQLRRNSLTQITGICSLFLEVNDKLGIISSYPAYFSDNEDDSEVLIIQFMVRKITDNLKVLAKHFNYLKNYFEAKNGLDKQVDPLFKDMDHPM